MNKDRVDAASFDAQPERYILVDGHGTGAPTCSFGNVQEIVGYDTKDKVYVRFTKSVYKKLRNSTLIVTVVNEDGTIKNNL